jgi:hypothetical protein
MNSSLGVLIEFWENQFAVLSIFDTMQLACIAFNDSAGEIPGALPRVRVIMILRVASLFDA